MQVPVNMNNAWNWLTNTQLGQATFSDKIQNIIAIVQGLVADKKQPVAALTQLQMEEMALLQYGGQAKSLDDPADQYWVIKLSAGTWQWVKNGSVTPNGKKYVTTVYSAQPPTSTTCSN